MPDAKTPARPTETTMACADCGQVMVVRVNKATQTEFLGCSKYPLCDHTEPLPEWLRLKKLGAPQLPGFEV